MEIEQKYSVGKISDERSPSMMRSKDLEAYPNEVQYHISKAAMKQKQRNKSCKCKSKGKNIRKIVKNKGKIEAYLPTHNKFQALYLTKVGRGSQHMDVKQLRNVVVPLI